MGRLFGRPPCGTSTPCTENHKKADTPGTRMPGVLLCAPQNTGKPWGRFGVLLLGTTCNLLSDGLPVKTVRRKCACVLRHMTSAIPETRPRYGAHAVS